MDLKNSIQPFLFSDYGNMRVLVVIGILIAALIADTSIGKISGLIGREWAASMQIVYFILIAAAYWLGQYFVLGFAKQRGSQIMKNVSFVNKIHKVNILVQYILSAIIAFVILQITFASFYYTITLVPAITISCSLGVSMMIILTRQFFRWYKSNKNRLILLYGSSSAVIAIHLGFTCIFVDAVLLNMGTEVSLHSGFTGVNLDPSSVFGILNYFYFISAILSFVLLWGTTVLLLRHFSRGSRKLKFWAVVCIPLVFFLVQYFISYLNLFVPLLSLDPILFSVLFTLIFTLSLPIGGILFGFAFLLIVRKLPSSSIIKNYITITAFGFILFFVSDQISVIYASYPPYGLATISFVGLASYLILLGIYYSAISLSQDVKLRRSIRRSALKELELLDHIGMAHMKQQLEKRVLNVVKAEQNNMIEQTGVQTSLTEGDIKHYLDQVLGEIEKTNNRRSSSVKEKEEE